MWAPSKRPKLVIITIALLLTLSVAKGEALNNNSTSCADLLMLFARGSSSNPYGLNTDIPFSDEFQNGIDDPDNPGKKMGAEEVPGSFFRWMERRIQANYPHVDYKAISIHHSPEKNYSSHGYPAVGIFDFNPFQQNFHNMIQARLTWWDAGAYNISVNSGADELVGQIRDNVINCPSQRIVVGGYSQGAHVVHEAMKRTTLGEHNMIDNVVLFGDPKFIASDGDTWNPLDVHAVYPWVRGTTALKERGLGGAEIPYIPEDLWFKTISWCHEDDFVCTGLSGLSHSFDRNLVSGSPHSDPNNIFGQGHVRYPVFGVPDATAEVINNMHSHLAQLESSRGGINSENTPYETLYDASVRDLRPIDVMLAFDYTDGNQDAQGQYFLNLKDITKTYQKNFPDLRTGGIVYSDLAGDASSPNRSYIAGLMRPMNQLSSNLESAFNGRVIYSSPPGGGDYPSNHGMLIERGGMFASWRPDAVKHLVLFTERPATERYTYNMCEQNTVNSLPHTGTFPCASGNRFSTRDLPEWCLSVLEVLSQSTCSFGGTFPTTYISRELSDAVRLASAKGFVVDIVQSHPARSNQPGYSPERVDSQLRSLAESTGGLYLKYENQAFDESAMRDAVWKILNHKPRILSISAHQLGGLLDFSPNKTQVMSFEESLPLHIGQHNRIGVTPVSGAERYEWDFDGDTYADMTTAAPVAEYRFDTSPNFMSVRGIVGERVLAQKIITINPLHTENTWTETSTHPRLQDIHAAREGTSKTVFVSWTLPDYASSDGVMLISDGLGAVMQTVPARELQSVVFFDGSEIQVQYFDSEGESEPVFVEIISILTEPDQLTDLSANVGQSIDKIVEQDEPNNTESGDSNRPAPVSLKETASASAPQLITAQSEVTTVIKGAQDVKTNPQGEVGGVDAVNKLFQGEDFGLEPEEQQEKNNSILVVILLIGGLVVLCLVIGTIILKKNSEDEEKSQNR